MSDRERQQRHRARLRQRVDVADVLASLERDYCRVSVDEQTAIRAGVKKLMRRWEKNAAVLARYWRNRVG